MPNNETNFHCSVPGRKLKNSKEDSTVSSVGLSLSTMPNPPRTPSLQTSSCCGRQETIAIHARHLSQFHKMRNNDETKIKSPHIQKTIADILMLVKDEDLSSSGAESVEEAPLSNATNKISSSPALRLRSCIKPRDYSPDCSSSLPSRLKCHVHFNTEMESRWSNGCPSFPPSHPPKHLSRSLST